MKGAHALRGRLSYLLCLGLLALAAGLWADPGLAQQRTSVGQRANTPQTVEFETLNTFVQALKGRLTTEVDAALGEDKRIENEFTLMSAKLAQVDTWLTELEATAFTGAETDARTCALGKATMPTCANNQRQVWRGNAWTCESRQSFEPGATCATASTPEPTACPTCTKEGCTPGGGAVMNCCSAWVCLYTTGGALNVCP